MIVIIQGTTRKENLTKQVVEKVETIVQDAKVLTLEKYGISIGKEYLNGINPEHQEFLANSDKIIIVAPAYFADMPPILSEFFARFSEEDAVYVFAKPILIISVLNTGTDGSTCKSIQAKLENMANFYGTELNLNLKKPYVSVDKKTWNEPKFKEYIEEFLGNTEDENEDT